MQEKNLSLGGSGRENGGQLKSKTIASAIRVRMHHYYGKKTYRELPEATQD